MLMKFRILGIPWVFLIGLTSDLTIVQSHISLVSNGLVNV